MAFPLCQAISLKRIQSVSIQIQGGFALIAAFGTPEHFMTALGAMIPCDLVFNPLFRSLFPPIGNRSQNHFLPDRHRELLDQLTGELLALMAPLIPLCLGAIPDLTTTAKNRGLIGKTPLTMNRFRG
jgi:hypothetical protein